MASAASDCCASLGRAVRRRRLAGTTRRADHLGRSAPSAPHLLLLRFLSCCRECGHCPCFRVRFIRGHPHADPEFVITAARSRALLLLPSLRSPITLWRGIDRRTGPINTISASPLDKRETAASIAFEWIKLDPLSNALLANFGATHGHDVHVHSLSSIMAPAISFGYGLTADFTISARLPVVVRSDIKEAAHTSTLAAVLPRWARWIFSVISAGIGDLTLLGQYRFYNNRATRTELALLLGGQDADRRHRPPDRHWGAVRCRVPARQRLLGRVVRPSRPPSASAGRGIPSPF